MQKDTLCPSSIITSNFGGKSIAQTGRHLCGQLKAAFPFTSKTTAAAAAAGAVAAADWTKLLHRPSSIDRV